MSGLKKQRWKGKLLFTQHTEIVVVYAPLKMSQWMQGNECAPAGQMSVNKPMKTASVGWILDTSSLLLDVDRHLVFTLRYYMHNTTSSI